MRISLKNALRSQMVIYGLFLLSVVLTFYAYSVSLSGSKEKYLAEFRQEHLELTETIEKKLHVYEQVLWSGVALINSSDNVRRAEWEVFSNIVDIKKHWPGIQALGYALALPADSLSDHEQAVRSEGFAGYAVYPSEKRPFYTSIVYIEPFDWRNQRAFGYDMWSNPTRQQAMKAAMLSGEARASGAITLVQETSSDKQHGFLIYTPVYRDPQKLNRGVVKSLKDLQGWVYAPFRINDFMRSVVAKLPAYHQIEILDLNAAAKGARNDETPDTLYFRASNSSAGLLTQRKSIPVFGRKWEIVLATPPFNALTQLAKESLFLFILSLCINILLLITLLSYRKSQIREEQGFKDRYKDLIDTLNEKTAKIDELGKENVILEGNIDTLQEWLQEREVRINELKMNQKDTI